ncbi:MAG TPA: bifunctional glutamine synthetase adenylyltransferase/deadenyltransferase, partial [Marinobacterium sp.]|nr:bifunctional glutamine synthetase adenylyltransferase/deadenyltransferase [Marinobacterium sp.]
MQPLIADYLSQQLDRVANAISQTPMTAYQRQQLEAVLIGSDYVRDQLQRRPELLAATLERVEQPYSSGELSQRAADALQLVDSEESLMRELRRLRQREMIRIIWRDLTGLADLAETTRTLSDLADA